LRKIGKGSRLKTENTQAKVKHFRR
jgi:hypothetical protein